MRRKAAFAARMQLTIIVCMLVSFLLIIQEFHDGLYRLGLGLLIVAALSQMAFGNMPPAAEFKEASKIMLIAFGAVVAVFGLGILLAPVLIRMGG
jgi:hypothetical protein